MRTDQCGRCLRYRGDLQCDAFPEGIPEDIATGQYDHSRKYGEESFTFEPIPEDALVKAEGGTALIEHINKIVDREDETYTKVKEALKSKGYVDSDFAPGGPLYGYSTNELLNLLGGQDGS